MDSIGAPITLGGIVALIGTVLTYWVIDPFKKDNENGKSFFYSSEDQERLSLMGNDESKYIR